MTMRYVQFAPGGNRSLIGALDGAPRDKELTTELVGISKTLKIRPEVSDPIGSLFNVNTQIALAVIAAPGGSVAPEIPPG